MDLWPQVLENHINLWGMSLLQPSSALDRCLYHSGLSHVSAVIQATVSLFIASASSTACGRLAFQCQQGLGSSFSMWPPPSLCEHAYPLAEAPICLSQPSQNI